MIILWFIYIWSGSCLDDEISNPKKTSFTWRLPGDQLAPKIGEDDLISDRFFGLYPLPVRVTTRIITFLVGNHYKPSFPLLLGGGTTQQIFLRWVPIPPPNVFPSCARIAAMFFSFFFSTSLKTRPPKMVPN